MPYRSFHEDQDVYYLACGAGRTKVRPGTVDRIYRDSVDILDTDAGIVTVDKRDVFLAEQDALDAARDM